VCVCAYWVFFIICSSRLNRASQHELELDVGDKQMAQHLDDACHQLKNSSHGIQYHTGIERSEYTSVGWCI